MVDPYYKLRWRKTTTIRNSKVGFLSERRCQERNLSRIETLIVWTDSDGLDMALSFQESEGCALVW